ncbi:hypothetical protein P8452_57951 [Trifolium repens]|nr:hypothetical protein P8452_57951 [Trifolium repens]
MITPTSKSFLFCFEKGCLEQLYRFKHTAKLLQIHRLFPDFGFVFPLLAEKIRVALIEFFFNTETQLQLKLEQLQAHSQAASNSSVCFFPFSSTAPSSLRFVGEFRYRHVEIYAFTVPTRPAGGSIAEDRQR